MNISVEKARRLVISSCQTRSGGVPDGLALDAALEVYVESAKAAEREQFPPRVVEPLADWERELLARTLRPGDLVRSVAGAALGDPGEGGLKAGTLGTVESGLDSDGDWYVIFDGDIGGLYVKPHEIERVAR